MILPQNPWPETGDGWRTALLGAVVTALAQLEIGHELATVLVAFMNVLGGAFVAIHARRAFTHRKRTDGTQPAKKQQVDHRQE